METTFKENSECFVTKYSVGREDKIVPMALELEVKKGSDLFDSILSFSEFNKLKEKQLNYNPEGAENSKNYKKYRKRFLKDMKDTNLKITIKIELEKYE